MLTFSPKLTEAPKVPLWDATPDLFKPTDPEQEKMLMLNGFGIPPASEQRWLPVLPAKTDEP